MFPKRCVEPFVLLRFRYTVLSHGKCTTPVRQTAFSKDGSVLVCVCDDATVWRWDRVAP